MISKTDIKNCLVTHCSSKIFNLSISFKASMSLIERCFPLIGDSDNFLELDFICVNKILASNGLNIDSELQVFNAADSWLCHDITERKKFAKELLSKVGLPLLSVPALKQILDRVSSNYHECTHIIEDVLVKKQQLNLTSCNITSRYCNQSDFKILVCGGKNVNLKKASKSVNLFYANNFSEVKSLPHMKEARWYFEAVCFKGEIYVFGGVDNNNNVINTVEKYSPGTNTWEYMTKMKDNRKFFIACSFMDNVYIIGGYIHLDIKWHDTATCFEFNTKILKWNEISGMNIARRFSACSVFEGRIVVSGGYDSSNTVEAYDHVGDTWENMPNMTNGRFRHKSVAVKNKLFVIGGLSTNNCEVFDSNSNKFTFLKHPSRAYEFELYDPFKVITVGSKIFIFQSNSEVKTYDFENDEWSVKVCEATKNLMFFSCVKIPV